MRVGYVRCSTAEQNEARQLKMMEEQKVEKIFIDKASGKNVNRKDFKAMMTFVRAGDTVIVESISRIARNTSDLLAIISSLTEKGVEFVSLKENIDTTTPHGRFMLTVFGAQQNWNERVFSSGSARALRLQRLKASTKAASLWQSMKPSSALSAPAGAPVRLPQLLQCRRLD